MAKIKSRRHKYHLAAKKRAGNEDTDTPMEDTIQQNLQKEATFPEISFNPFAGMKIDASKLRSSLPPVEEWDRKTVVSIAKESSKGMNKRDKVKLRRQLLLKKLEATRQLELDLKDRKKRQSTVITKDLKPLLDSLPSVDLNFHEAAEETKKQQKLAGKATKKDRNGMKAKQKQKAMLKDISVFKQVLEDKHFKENPTETILNHVTFYVQKEYKDKEAEKKKKQPSL